MAQFFSAEWLAVSSRGGPPFHPSPLQQQGLPHEAEPGAERQAQGGTRTRSPETPGASAGELSCESSSEQDSWEGSSRGSDASPAAPSRGRTKYSARQLQELESSFQHQPYLGAREKRRLSEVLKLSPEKIKTWFQNRRMKHKRQAKDASIRAFFFSDCHHHGAGISGLEYNTVCPPSGMMPLHPVLPCPALPTHLYRPRPQFVPNIPFQFSAPFSYQPTGQVPLLTPDYERQRFHPHHLTLGNEWRQTWLI